MAPSLGWTRTDTAPGAAGPSPRRGRPSGANFRALRREWKSIDAPAVIALIAALVVGYVAWQGLR